MPDEQKIDILREFGTMSDQQIMLTAMMGHALKVGEKIGYDKAIAEQEAKKHDTAE